VRNRADHIVSNRTWGGSSLQSRARAPPTRSVQSTIESPQHDRGESPSRGPSHRGIASRNVIRKRLAKAEDISGIVLRLDAHKPLKVEPVVGARPVLKVRVGPVRVHPPGPPGVHKFPRASSRLLQGSSSPRPTTTRWPSSLPTARPASSWPVMPRRGRRSTWQAAPTPGP
jgi:hypothetical protein